jgi:hypothetical protein
MYTIDKEDLHDLLASRRAPLVVGHLPLEVRNFFGRSKEPVLLSRESYQHILRKHRNHVMSDEILLLPKLLREGRWTHDKGLTCAVYLRNTRNSGFLKAAVKVTADRTESYVTSIHRTRSRHISQLEKRGTPLRAPWNS